jgi:hypothetical protein
MSSGCDNQLGFGKDILVGPAMQHPKGLHSHSAYHMERKGGEGFSVEIRCWEAEACTPPGDGM